MIYFKNTEQISELTTYKHVSPVYGKSTTDPTYYEPAATRIANMKKSAGVIMEGIYDFYTKDDVSKFNEKNFEKNIKNASPDPMFQKGLTREEVSQITTSYENKAESMLEKKKSKQDSKQERINEAIETSKAIDSTIQNINTEE